MTKPCPICDRAAQAPHRPFCSQGCRDRDLLRWFGDGYALPGRPVDDEASDGLDSPRAHD